MPQDWEIEIDDVVASLHLSENGQVGIFPEQYENWVWTKEQVESANRPLNILNGFAYTGIASLFASDYQNRVTHVDAAKSVVNRARENAKRSNMEDATIRWIVDDMLKFMQAEAKRGNKYDGIILDPPAFGRSGKKTWKFERDIDELLDLIPELISDNPVFIILSCHNQFLRSEDLKRMLKDLNLDRVKNIEAIDLILESENGKDLPSSLCARLKFEN
jgi:23S rRNA (cytosine1962-C5)-methyltransferase